MNKTLFKTITYFVGSLLIILVGLLFVLITDLYMKNTSGWLFFDIILSFGAGALFLFSESFKHKRGLFYLFKGLGILVTVVFVIYLFKFKASDIFLPKITLKLFKNAQGYYPQVSSLGVYFSWIVLGFVTLATQFTNVVLNVIFFEKNDL